MNIAAFFSNTAANAERQAAGYRQDARNACAASDLALARGDKKAAEAWNRTAVKLMRWAAEADESAGDFKHLGSRLEVIP